MMLEARGNNNGGCGCHAELMPLSANQWLWVIMQDGQLVAAVVLSWSA